ncbi:MAG: hypothetical protein WCV93_00735 [Candidatus Shapirobacteria bacterium]|jgi:hypothetical protein
MIFLFSFLFLISYFLFLAPPVGAQCPVCIVTVGGGMLIAKKLGIDDLLVSIWISALNTALAFWLAPKLNKLEIGNWKLEIFSKPIFLSLILLLTTLAYFITTGQTGHSANKLLGIDKIIFGQVLGFLGMLIGNITYLNTKKKLGYAPFPYAKVVFPVSLVLLLTLAFKFAFNL